MNLGAAGMRNANEPAFPQTSTTPAFDRDSGKYYSDTVSTGGLTKREHAAILLRVPKSGDDEIDATIREANRRDAATMMYQQFLAGSVLPPGFDAAKQLAFAAVRACEAADALIAELERTA